MIGYLSTQRGEQVDHLLAGEELVGGRLPELVALLVPLVEELGAGAVQRDGEVLVAAGGVAGLVDGVEDELDRLLVVEVGGEAALVADVGVVAGLLEDGLEAGGRPRRPCGCPRRSDLAPMGMTMNSWKSILLSACLPPLMMLAIGTGRTRALAPADVAVERQPVRGGGGLGGGQADAEDGVGAELPLVRRCRRRRSARGRGPTWSAGVAADDHLGQRVVDVGDGLGDALAAGSASCRRRGARPPRGCRCWPPRGPPRGRACRRPGSRRPRRSGCRGCRGSRGRGRRRSGRIRLATGSSGGRRSRRRGPGRSA